VAATPETVKKYIAKGFKISVVSGAGLNAAYPDADYLAAGAELPAA
jgi:NAD(P) transhydrogenase subunit alpha